MLQETPEQIKMIIKRQREIDSLADVDYQCYYLKIKRSNFYKLYVWDVITQK